MKIFFRAFLCITLIVVPQLIFAQTGKDLFNQNCAACHTVGNGKLVGPDLIGIEKTRSMPWLLKWIPSSQTLIKSGDKTAKKLFMYNSQIPMPDQALSQTQIKDVLAYISQVGEPIANSSSTNKNAVDTTIASSKTIATSKVQTNEKVSTTKSDDFIFDSLRGNNEKLIIIGITLIVFLLVVIMILLNVIKGLSEELHDNKRYSNQ